MATYVLMTKTGEEEHLAEVLNKTVGAEFCVTKRKKTGQKDGYRVDGTAAGPFPSLCFYHDR